MYFRTLSGNKPLKTLVVLGAGASRGASFVDNTRNILPPLDNDYFSVLQHLQYDSSHARDLLGFVRGEFGISHSMSMEDFFSCMEHKVLYLKEFNGAPGSTIRRYTKPLGQFYRSLPALFKEAIGDEKCTYHQSLVDKLYDTDVILSFNYDCLIDSTLRSNGIDKWNPDLGGYGFAVKRGGSDWCWRGVTGKAKKSLKLLKPHGSLHWHIYHGRKTNGKQTKLVDLRTDHYEVRSAKGRIIPPIWAKNFSETPFVDVWKSAHREIPKCEAVIVVGYSVPFTDFFSRVLFEKQSGAEKLVALVVVNPDKPTRQRFIDLVSWRIERHTMIVELDNLEQLAELTFVP